MGKTQFRFSHAYRGTKLNIHISECMLFRLKEVKNFFSNNCLRWSLFLFLSSGSSHPPPPSTIISILLSIPSLPVFSPEYRRVSPSCQITSLRSTIWREAANQCRSPGDHMQMRFKSGWMEETKDQTAFLTPSLYQNSIPLKIQILHSSTCATFRMKSSGTWKRRREWGMSCERFGIV